MASKKAVAYYRVSTETQNYSYQEMWIKDWAKENNIEIVKDFGDIISSASMNRPGMNSLKVYLSENWNEIDYMLVLHPDRLTRNTQDAEQFMNWLDTMDIQLIFTGSPELNTITPEGRKEIMEGMRFSDILRKANNLASRIQIYYVKLNGGYDPDLPERISIRVGDADILYELAELGCS